MILERVSAILLIAGSSVLAGKFSCNWVGSKEEVFLDIPRPPDALIRARNLRIQWEGATGSFQRTDQLRQLIESAISKEFSFTDASPEASIKLSVLAYEPVQSRTYSQNETRSVKVGEKTVTDKNGKSHQQDVYDSRSVPVEYWEAKGSLRIGGAVTDKAGTPLDSHTFSAAHDLKKEIAVNGTSSLGKGTLRSPEALETNLLDTVAFEVRRRYTATLHRVEVTLSCDDELKTGNKYAKGGQFAEALEAWKSAKMKKNPADQTFNMAIAKEALSYGEYAKAQSIQDMLPLFKEAMDLYDQARKQDPEEKYMQRQAQRLEVAKKNIDNVLKQYEVQQEEARVASEKANEAVKLKLAEEARQNEREAAVKDSGTDGPEEAKFRTMARLRLAGLPPPVTEQQERDIMAFGQRTYTLNELKSYRVVKQEVARKSALAVKLKDYEDTFQSVVADGVLTAAEKAQMKELQALISLDDTETAAITAKFTFRDASVAAPPAPSGTKPVAPRSTPAPKPPSPAKPKP